LRPFLDFLFATENVPNPTSVTFCPFFKAERIAFNEASSDFNASVLLSPAPEAILSTNSALVIVISPFHEKLVAPQKIRGKKCPAQAGLCGRYFFE